MVNIILIVRVVLEHKLFLVWLILFWFWLCPLSIDSVIGNERLISSSPLLPWFSLESFRRTTWFKQETLILFQTIFNFVLFYIVHGQICMSEQYYWLHGQGHGIFCSSPVFCINFILVLLVTQSSHSSIMPAVAFFYKPSLTNMVYCYFKRSSCSA